MSKFDIYGVGAALVDTEIKVSDADLRNFGIEKGVMTLVDEPRQHQLLDMLSEHLCHSKRASGGSAANSIIAAQYFGASTFYSCKVANDENGQFYLRDLKQAGVTYLDDAGRHDGITGKCLVMITEDAERTMNTFLGVSATLGTNEIDEAALSASKYLYLEGYLVSLEGGLPAAVTLRSLAQKHQVKVALSLSDPMVVKYFRPGFAELIGSGIDLLFCNQAEAMQHTETSDLDAAVAGLKSAAKSFVVTLGADGALLFDGADEHRIAAPKVTAVDTNGAGDMFAGAFIYGLSQGWDQLRCAQFAVQAAALVVSNYGPRLQPEEHQTLLQGFDI